MADQKLSQLTTATLPLNNNDLFYVVQNTTSTSSTSQSIKFVDLSSQISPGGGSSITVLDKSVTATTVTNTASETTLYSATIAAQSSTGIVRFTIAGTWLNNTGSPATVIIKAKLGATTMFQNTSLSIGTNANIQTFHWEGMIANLNATNSQRISGLINIGGVVSPTTGVGGVNTANSGLTSYSIAAFAGTSAEDWTASLLLDFTVTLSTGSTNLTMTKEFAVVEQL